MSEPTSIMTFEDLLIRVAREAGIAYYGPANSVQAMIPIDYGDLHLCKEIVNDGIREFIADAPVSGWRWRRRILSLSITGTRTTGVADSASTTTIVDLDLADVYDTDDEIVGYYCYITDGTGQNSWAIITGYTALTGTVTVSDWLDENGLAGGIDPVTDSTFAITSVETVGGDIARYPLPENFYGEVTGPIHYASDTSHSISIEWVDESFIRARRASSVQTSHPQFAAIRALEPLDGTISLAPKRRKELILDPQPSQDDVIEFPYLLLFDKMDMESGVGNSGSDTTLTDSDRTEGPDYFNGWKITVIAGTGRGSNAIVTDYDNRNGIITGWTDNGDNTYTAACVGHNMSANDICTIDGASSDFNETHTLTSINANDFTITLAATGYTVTAITGTWKQRQIEVADWLTVAGAGGGTNPSTDSVYKVEPLYNLHPAGANFDQVIKAVCLAHAEMVIEEIAAGFIDKYLKKDLSKAYEIDARMAPRKLQSMYRGVVRERVWKDVTYN